MDKEQISRTLKVANAAKKGAPYITMDLWLALKGLLAKESNYKNSYPCSLEDKAKFIIQLVR